MTAKRIEIFVIVIIIALVGIVYAFKQKPVVTPISPVTSIQTQDQGLPEQNRDQIPSGGLAVKPDANATPTPTDLAITTTIEYPGQEGKNALELLKAGHRVDTKNYSFGDMVTGIDGIIADSKHFWALYINDQFSQVGASSLITKSTDMIKWQIDSIVDSAK